MTSALELQNALDIMVAVVETIRTSGPQGAPSGPMFAACSAKGVSLDGYTRLMVSVVRTGLVEKRGDVYHWVGPEIK